MSNSTLKPCERQMCNGHIPNPTKINRSRGYVRCTECSKAYSLVQPTNSIPKRKPTKPTKPRSNLQEAQSKVTWLTNFSLQECHWDDRVIPVSSQTRYLINCRNVLTRKLKAAMAEEYIHYKEKILIGRAMEESSKIDKE
jgi:hypothetical protein